MKRWQRNNKMNQEARNRFYLEGLHRRTSDMQIILAMAQPAKLTIGQMLVAAAKMGMLEYKFRFQRR